MDAGDSELSTQGHWEGHTSPDPSPHLTIGVLVQYAIMVGKLGLLQRITEPQARGMGAPCSQL